jgi:hypothetical protein
MTTPSGTAGPGAPFPQWTVVYGGFGCIPGSVRVAKVANATAKVLAESVSFPCNVHFFTSQAAAQAYANSVGGSGSIPGVNQALNAANQGLNAATGVAQCVGGTLIGKVCVNFEEWFLRIGEAILGVMLIGVGIAHITGVENAISTVIQKLPVPI